MTKTLDNIKQTIITKYDREASEKNNSDWLEKGGDARVPESSASHYFIDRKVNESLKMCSNDISDNFKAMEIGCSFGHMTSLLAKKFNFLTAVDISPESIKIAEKRLLHYGIKNVNFVVDDAEMLNNIKDNSYEIIFSFSTIRFCPNPLEALKSMYKKLKPSGIIVVDFPNKFSPWHLFVKKAVGIDKHIYDHLFSSSDVIYLLNKSGFKVSKIKKFLFTSKRLPSKLLPIFKIVEWVLEKLPFASNFAGIIMVKGIKN